VSPRTTFRKLSELAGDLAPEELAEVVRYYDSEIAFTDHHVGRVLDRLERLELLDRTLVVFTADHGEELLDHGRFGHAHSLYQELVGVPLILRIPGEAPRVASEPAALVDLFPTILDHLGLEAPEGLVGHSLLARPSDRTLFAETSRKAELRAAARGRWKLVLDVESGETRLYDLRADPLERSPLPAEGPEAVALRSELEAWMGRLAQPGPVRRVELTPGRVEALGDLGYAED
jgi:arylsulfatase A-like enzyme